MELKKARYLHLTVGPFLIDKEPTMFGSWSTQ